MNKKITHLFFAILLSMPCAMGQSQSTTAEDNLQNDSVSNQPNTRQANSLKLTSGIFGTPVAIGEADLQYEANGFSARVLGSIISIPDASDINRAYANNIPQTAYGAYAEIAYNIFERMNQFKAQQMILFVRYEKLDMNSKIPANGITDGTLNQQHIITGLTYLPIKNVAVKLDMRLLHTGNQNPELVINPSLAALPYKANNTFVNLGIGFSF